MRTKALLIAAAAMAATVITSEAQVYSQNIVGYVNLPQVGNLGTFALPLDAAGGNSATNVFPNVYSVANGYGPLDGDTMLIWNGASFTTYVFDSLKTTGFGDKTDNNSPQSTGVALPTPTLSPGQLVFIDNLNGAFTNTVVGTVHVDFAATGTQTVGVTTNNVGGNDQFIASKLPIAGGLSSVLGITNVYNAANGYGPQDGNIVYVPNIGAGGFTGYTEYVFDSLQPTGFGNKTDNNSPETGTQFASPEPVIPVGGGFLIDNINGSFVWTQSL
jgi:hypothetical protein